MTQAGGRAGPEGPPAAVLARFAAERVARLATRSAEALSNETGVNVDTELSMLLDLEHTYQASARILSTVNQMLDTLLQAAG